MKIILALLLLCCAGCATNTTKQIDVSYEAITNGTKIASVPIRSTTTITKARTVLDSKSSLANFKATQSDKTQSTSIGSLSQESNSTNTVAKLQALLELANAIK